MTARPPTVPTSPRPAGQQGGPGGGGGGDGECDHDNPNDRDCGGGDPPTAKAIDGRLTVAEGIASAESIPAPIPDTSAGEPERIDLADVVPDNPKPAAQASGYTYNVWRQFVWG